MLFREIITVYCKNPTEHTNTLCGQNAEIESVKAGGVYTNGFKSLKRYMQNQTSSWVFLELQMVQCGQWIGQCKVVLPCQHGIIALKAFALLNDVNSTAAKSGLTA
jgi:hypothetical protein